MTAKNATVVHPNKLHVIIHSAAASAAGVGAGLAQIPGSDAPVLITIQSAMIVAIAGHFGNQVGKEAAVKMLLPFSATVAGRGASQALVGWIPGYGNVINAITAATLTEAIGWAAVAYFKDGHTA